MSTADRLTGSLSHFRNNFEDRRKGNMKKMFVLAGVALLCASLGWAQQSAPSADSNAASSSIRGCLSGAEGNYMLTQQDGTVFRLVGKEDQLKNHIGHEVMVTGQVSASGSGSAPDQGESNSQNSAGSSGSSTSGNTVEVSDIKMVAKRCSSESGAGQSRY
jgi:hypothetical protein